MADNEDTEKRGTMVRIEQEIYDRVTKVVNENKVEWATIQQFINKACLRLLEREEKRNEKNEESKEEEKKK